MAQQAQIALRHEMREAIAQIHRGDYSHEEEILDMMDAYGHVRDTDNITFHGLILTETYNRLVRLFLNAPVHYEEPVSNFVAPTETTRILKRADVETPLEDCCGICCENHTLVECATTQCGHCFGATCFETWCNTRNNGNLALTCPMCMATVSALTKYQPRKNYKKN